VHVEEKDPFNDAIVSEKVNIDTKKSENEVTDSKYENLFIKKTE
jgi:hypothetical protein